AGPVETRFVRAGYPVLTNSSPHRMDDAVPLLIPEVNPDHLALLDACKQTGGGFIVANPNCSTAMIALALAPLAARFGVVAGPAGRRGWPGCARRGRLSPAYRKRCACRRLPSVPSWYATSWTALSPGSTAMRGGG